jgi:NAD(P)-dependent dehydrogenase (short-subunit alcohol dehydrogenase family)
MPSARRSGPITPGVAFVTGGARGLGNAIAVSFAKEGARAVVIVDIQDEKTTAEGVAAIEEYGAEVLSIRCDVTNEKQVEDAVAQAVAKFGRIDYGVNFAGIIGPIGNMWETDYAKIQKVVVRLSPMNAARAH